MGQNQMKIPRTMLSDTLVHMGATDNQLNDFTCLGSGFSFWSNSKHKLNIE